MKIILVDDEKSMLLIMKKMLSKIPNAELVGSFQSTGEAYRFIKDNKPDIIFLDIQMPEESGLEFAGRISKEFKEIVIIFLTAHKEYALEAFQVHAFDYLVKPITMERLVEVLRVTLSHHRYLFTHIETHLKPNLFVYYLGDMRIVSATGEMIKLNSSKSYELLAYLLLRRGKYISKWSILEDVFRGMQIQNAETYLHTTLYKLRKALESCGIKSTIISANEKYMIDIKTIYVDYYDLENRVNRVKEINDTNLEYALETEKLYEAELFYDKDYYWAILERERICDLYWSFAKKLGSYLIDHNHLETGMQVLKKLNSINELDEEINCLLMRGYAIGRDRPSLIKLFENYKCVLERELEIKPGKTITELYEKLSNSFE